MNLVKLFTIHGPMYIDTNQLASPTRRILTIYTARGNKLSDVGRTAEIREKASFGVHRDNLFATRELAVADSDRIYAELFGKAATTTAQFRADASAQS